VLFFSAYALCTNFIQIQKLGAIFFKLSQKNTLESWRCNLSRFLMKKLVVSSGATEVFSGWFCRLFAV
jgi:hypothetical protein